MRKIVGLFVIFLTTTLSFVPALNTDFDGKLDPFKPSKNNDTNNRYCNSSQ